MHRVECDRSPDCQCGCACHRPRCLATMAYTGEACWRFAGHRGSHRSQYVMEDELRRRRKRGWVAA